MRQFTIIPFLFFSLKIFACDCAERSLLQKIQNSDFIGIVKILKISPDKENHDYHNIQIELKSIYKGPQIASLKILSVLNSSCAFYAPENSIWLIFATYGKNKILSFDRCSGSLEIDRKIVSRKYPNAESNYNKMISMKIEVLEFLKMKNIQSTNPYNLEISYCQNWWTAFKGYNIQNKFAVYEVLINRDLSINKIVPLQEFDNHKLAIKMLNCIKNNLVFYNKHSTILPDQSKLILVYYFYPAENKYLSFISQYDL